MEISKSKPKLNLQKAKLAQLWLYIVFYVIMLVENCLTQSNDKLPLFDASYAATVNCIPHDTKYTCDCHYANQRMILPRLSGHVFHVEVNNCKLLTIEPRTIEDTISLRKITMKNIDSLLLKQYALAFPRYASNTPLIIEFQKVHFEAIESHAIIGNIEEISFLSGSIDMLHPFCFTTLKDSALLLKMHNILIKKMESQAFKKFAVDELDITNCVFKSSVPSKAFYELEVKNSLYLHNNKFNSVHSHAFSFRLINKLFIIDNYFESVDAEWFEAHIKESIVIRNNYFGPTSQIAFRGFHIHRDYLKDQMELSFVNNTVKKTATELSSLDFDAKFDVDIKHLKYDNMYSCQLLDMTQKPPVPKSQFFRTNIDSIYFLAENNKDAGNNGSHIVLSQIIQTQCRPRSYLWIIIGAVMGVILLLLIGGAIAWYLWARRKDQKRKLDVVMPEPRTYKETQIVYQIENAGLLKTDL